MYAFPQTSSHLSHHSNSTATSHETANTNNNNHHNNNNNHHHRDSSIDKESSLGESSIFVYSRKNLPWSRKKRNVNRPTKSHFDWADS